MRIPIYSSSIDNHGIAQIREIIHVMGELFKTSYGPKGFDKLLFDHFNNHMMITNDGGAILEDIGDLLKPEFSKYIIKWGRIIEKEERDGIKTFYIMLGELLKIVEMLEQEGISPSLIINAIDELKNLWLDFLDKQALKLNFDISRIKQLRTGNAEIDSQERQFLEDFLKAIMRGKFSDKNTQHLSKISVEIFIKLIDNMEKPWTKVNEYLQIVKNPGILISETKLYPGIFLGKKPTNLTLFPREGLHNARVLLIRDKLYIDLPDGGDLGSKGPQFEITLSSHHNLQAMKDIANKHAQSIFDKIISVKPNLIITEKGVSRELESLLERNKIILVRRAKSKEFKLISQFLGADIVENINDITEMNIVYVKKIILKKIGKDNKIYITHALPDKQSAIDEKKLGALVIGGTIWNICEMVELYIHNNIIILKNLLLNGRYLLGGGNTEIKFVKYIANNIYSNKKLNFTKDKIRYVIERLIRGFLVIPQILATSCGMDPIIAITQLKSNNREKYKSNSYGINVLKCKIENMHSDRIYDNYSVRKKIILRTFIILKQIVRIDRVINIRHKTQKGLEE